MFLLFSLSPFHISASPSCFSANINEKIVGANQQKTTWLCWNHVSKVVAVYVANLTGLEKCPWCRLVQFIRDAYGVTALLCTRDGNHTLWLYIVPLSVPSLDD